MALRVAAGPGRIGDRVVITFAARHSLIQAIDLLVQARDAELAADHAGPADVINDLVATSAAAVARLLVVEPPPAAEPVECRDLYPGRPNAGAVLCPRGCGIPIWRHASLEPAT